MSETETTIEHGIAALDPEVLDTETATQLVERFARIERLAADGKALVARGVANSGAWRQRGRSLPGPLGGENHQTSVGQAVGVLETASQVAQLSSTDEAFRAGKLTEAQAQEITSAAAPILKQRRSCSRVPSRTASPA